MSSQHQKAIVSSGYSTAQHSTARHRRTSLHICSRIPTQPRPLCHWCHYPRRIHSQTHLTSHVTARHHCAFYPVRRLWSAGQGLLRHNCPRRRLASCMRTVAVAAASPTPRLTRRAGGHHGRPLCAKHDIWRPRRHKDPLTR